jgi:hypothetical protein
MHRKWHTGNQYMAKSAENRMRSNLELLPVMNVKSRPQYISALKKWSRIYLGPKYLDTIFMHWMSILTLYCSTLQIAHKTIIWDRCYLYCCCAREANSHYLIFKSCKSLGLLKQKFYLLLCAIWSVLQYNVRMLIQCMKIVSRYFGPRYIRDHFFRAEIYQ